MSDAKRPGVSVVIPALDEERAVKEVLRDVKAAARQMMDREVEIILVDDGSTDATAALARMEGVRVLSHPLPGGYGQALKTGIRAASHELVAILDCDGTYPASQLPELVRLGETYDMVVGARTGLHFRRSALENPLRTAFVWLSSFVTGTPIPDANSGMRVFRRSLVLPLLPRLPRAFSFTTTLTVVMTLEGRFVHYADIAYAARIGESKVRLVRDALRVAQTLAEVILTHNPLKLFLLLGLVPLFLSLVALFLDAPHGPIAAAVLFGTAILVFALGMVSAVSLFGRDRGSAPPRDPGDTG